MDPLTELLAGIPSEGVDAQQAVEDSRKEIADSQEEETPAESPADNKSEEESPASSGDKEEAKAESNNSEDEDKNLPFHKHPRWKQMYEENRQLREEQQRLKQEVDQRLTSVQSMAQQAKSVQLPERFVKLYGDNEEAWRLYKEEQDALKAEIKQEILRERESQETAKQEAVRKGEEYVQTSLQTLQEEGIRFDRNELMKFMVDFKEKYGTLPTDENDNIDFRKGYDLMMALKQDKNVEASAKSQARKKIADATATTSKGEPEEKEYLTAAELRKMHW